MVVEPQRLVVPVANFLVQIGEIAHKLMVSEILHCHLGDVILDSDYFRFVAQAEVSQKSTLEVRV